MTSMLRLPQIRESLKRALHFYPGLGIGICFPLGWAMALADHFPEAYIIFGLCLVWSEGLWLTSDFLLGEKKRSTRRPRRKKGATEEDIKMLVRKQKNRFASIKWGGLGLIALAGLISLVITYSWDSKWELEQTFGVLVPADDPEPAHRCDPSPDSMRIYAGGSLFWSGLHELTMIQIRGRKLITLDKQKGSVFISGDLYSADGDLAHFDRNHFETPSSRFKPDRPDRHTLIIFNKWHEEVLNIRFLNPNAIRVSGRFLVPGAPPVSIDENHIEVGKSSFANTCMGSPYSGVALFFN